MAVPTDRRDEALGESSVSVARSDNPRRIGHRQEVENVRPLPRRANRLVMTECLPQVHGDLWVLSQGIGRGSAGEHEGRCRACMANSATKNSPPPTPQAESSTPRRRRLWPHGNADNNERARQAGTRPRDRYSGLSSRVRLVRRCSVSGCAYLLRLPRIDQAQMPAPLPLARPRCASVG